MNKNEAILALKIMRLAEEQQIAKIKAGKSRNKIYETNHYQRKLDAIDFSIKFIQGEQILTVDEMFAVSEGRKSPQL